MPTEEQTQYDAGPFPAGCIPMLPEANSNVRAGQRLTISMRIVSKLSLVLERYGTPGGTLDFEVRDTDAAPGTLLGSKLLGNANDISTIRTWYEVIFDSPIAVNGNVRILCKPTLGRTGNFISLIIKSANVKANELATRESPPGTWLDDPSDYDAAYIYTYTVGSLPTATTQPCRDIRDTSAKGYGNVLELGDPGPTAHGHCWNTIGSPTISDSKTDLGAKATIGPFASEIIGLTPNTKYYVRAYTINAFGTVYGGEVTFTTGGSPDCWYHLNIKNINLPYEDLDRTKELHVILKNLSPTAKLSGEYGKVKVKIDYEPAA